ncbi:SMC family ATPase [Streptomyces sp. DSM 41527]|uniref:Nuclease SbcCD subunit C n=1 Tax=Streptomyces mooreae TaxID=3075523 RepID=A0ABU2TII2_9ACTN|nr:SMC family ATPase [Streptomyces sp. DSM 41527]MDT0460690.1 SMC family ATPase [Streptomyces sp. DSM 41527]
MKPMTLALTGFRSYPAQTTVDFTGKSLVAVLGDTGAGKSSLLDAIAFALFRKSSWDAKEPRQLIADGAQAMSVELTFLHDGQNWRVHRTMHATNPNAGRHHLKNLDTGEETDGATAVDNRIKTVLQMGYDTFLRVGLLPQGKFDQLLTASPKERSERLRELFGAESLESVRNLAARHGRTLQQLLGDAKAKRAPMPDNPQETAATAGAAADAATAQAERLNTAVVRITALQEVVSQARDTAAAATSACRGLATRQVTDAATVLDTLECAATDLTARRDLLNRRDEQAAAREKELTGAINEAEKQGEGRDTLTQAAMLLKTLAETAEEHRDERDRLASLTTQLDDEHDAIATTEAELAERAAHVEATAEAARATTQTSKQIRTHSTTVRTALDAALSAARRVADTAHAHATAVDRQKSDHKDLGPVEAEAAAAHKDLTAAETHLEALRLRKKAAAIAAELHPDDDCPVCRRQLPADFHPARADAEELTEAHTQREHAKSAHDRIINLRAEARAAVTAADKAVLERDHDRKSAQQTAQETTQEAERAFRRLEVLATEAGTDFDARSASARLTATTTALAAPATSTTASPHQLEQDTAAITHAIAACEHAATAHAEKLQAEEHRRTAGIEADRKTLAERKKAHHRDKKEVSAAQERHARAVTRTAADIGMLPARIQAMLPHDPIDIVVGQTDAATTAVNARQAELQELLDQREAARAEKAAVLAGQRTLDHDTHARLERPLDRLRDNLDAWTQAAEQARTRLDEADRPALPEAPTQPTIAEVRHYAAALSTTTSALGDKLTERAATATEHASTAERRLGEHAAALADIDDFDASADLTTPQSLHPLVAAAAQATKEAEDQRCKQREAQDLIKPAADLDFAITAGEARYEALEVLRRELVDAKFLGHLTTLRTRALLGVASDLLGQMSDGRFGFADDFDIISRSSGVAHHPNRLSGGEKFMASLALALALAELHSRSGPTLGSLFLDEGFAALDTTALDLALEVLRAQAGSDRLVMVISHLHAVAEAVDDVLRVERTTVGSTARWLTPAERDDMAQDNLASGLHSQPR